MPIHDWTKVEAGIFYDFHTVWIAEIRNVLNSGLLPDGYYALAEQHAGQYIADVLTLHLSPEEKPQLPQLPPTTGGTAVEEAPPLVRVRQTVELTTLSLRRTLAIRHISSHRVVALIEILSPGNKDGNEHVREFVDNTVTALERGVHVLVVDLFPPGAHDPTGIHNEILCRMNSAATTYLLPEREPQTLVSYVVGPVVEVYLEHVAVNAAIPRIPLFLSRARYVNLPLETTYLAAYRGVPSFWQDVLES